MRSLKVYGPPGTGKTHAMLGLFEGELKRTKPERVAFLTFTRAARLEALSRTSLPENELPYVKTIHAICYHLLGMSQSRIVKPRDVREFGKKIGVAITGVMHDPWSVETITGSRTQPTKADRLLQLNHLGRHRMIKLKEMMREAPMDLDFKYAKWFTQSYRAWKDAEGLLDYTDLLIRYLEEGAVLDLDVMFVDEAQDLSNLQWAVVRKLSTNVQRRYIAGDDDQAIFTWAGASPDIFNAEPAEDVKVLPQSFRIPSVVHQVSDRIIRRVKKRYEKEFKPRAAVGEYRPIGNLSAEHLGDPDTFVLFRNHYRGAQFAETLEGLGWPFAGNMSPAELPGVRPALEGLFRLREGRTVMPSQAKALVMMSAPGYLANGAARRAQSARSELQLNEVFSLGGALTDPIEKVLVKLPKLNYFSNVIRHAGLKALLNPPVTLMSIHQSKGRQANTVILDLEMAKLTWEHYLKDPDDEHRVFYVGATRAKERLLTLLPNEAMAYVI
jgi:superfamily I DNA/RNA helicase